MDLSKLHAITNNYQDARLISLRNWKRAHEFEDRDEGGPYVVAQEGYDPQDIGYTHCEFVLGKSGRWAPLAIFFGLPRELRQGEFVFPKAGDVMTLMGSLRSKVQVIRSGKELETEAPRPGDEDDDGLNEAVVEAKEKP